MIRWAYLELLEDLQQRRVARHLQGRERTPLLQRELYAVFTALLGLGKLTFVDGGVGLQHLDGGEVRERVFGEEILQTVPLANLPGAFHQQLRLSVWHFLCVIGEKLRGGREVGQMGRRGRGGEATLRRCVV